MRVTPWLIGIATVALVACGGAESQNTQSEEESDIPMEAAEMEQEEATITVTSPSFQNATSIPLRHTGEGEDVSPQLTWTGAPEETQEFALICDDPDAPRPEPWVHWVLYGIPAETDSLAEGSTGVGIEGKTTWGRTGYGGPMPPRGHGTHHYHFKIYALAKPLGLDPGASKAELLEAMEGHIVAQGELMGTYER